MLVDTSLESWTIVKQSLTKRQQIIYDAIRKYPDHTANEISKILRLPINTISGRFTELHNKSKINRIQRRPCAVTGNNSYTWRVSNEL